jgi:transposase
MGQFPTPAHLVSWARLSPRAIQSGARHRSGATGKGPTSRPRLGRRPTQPPRPTPFSTSATGASSGAAAAQGPGRHRPLDPGHRLAPARWPHRLLPRLGRRLLRQPVDKDRKIRSHVRQLEALGFTVTLAPAA